LLNRANLQTGGAHDSRLGFTVQLKDSRSGRRRWTFCENVDYVSLEVIEHLENPRKFVREIARILKVNGRCLITTPNQISLSSILCLLLKGQFQQFQDSSYPAHITALLPVDLMRIMAEAGLAFRSFKYTNDGRIPGTNLKWQVIPFFTGKWFSDNIAIVAVKA
jgi:SAM-dependent methyltransferase